VTKFIFVCYDHGTGGEPLAVAISKLAFCEDLKHEKHSCRTWTYDCFNKLFLLPYKSDWMIEAEQIQKSDTVRVVPSHYRPEILKLLYPDEIYVIINAPHTPIGITRLMKRIYKHVWLTKHPQLNQKIGYFIHNAHIRNVHNIHNKSTVPNLAQIQEMDKPIMNGEIECLIANKKINKENMKELFRTYAKDYYSEFRYKDENNTFVIEFEDVNNPKQLLQQLTTSQSVLE
tara:strand:+ start:62 stop:751 length:690 start_codon:yes stop_codon:yes gene_type:complete